MNAGDQGQDYLDWKNFPSDVTEKFLSKFTEEFGMVCRKIFAKVNANIPDKWKVLSNTFAPLKGDGSSGTPLDYIVRISTTGLDAVFGVKAAGEDLKTYLFIKAFMIGGMTPADQELRLILKKSATMLYFRYQNSIDKLNDDSKVWLARFFVKYLEKSLKDGKSGSCEDSARLCKWLFELAVREAKAAAAERAKSFLKMSEGLQFKDYKATPNSDELLNAKYACVKGTDGARSYYSYPFKAERLDPALFQTFETVEECKRAGFTQEFKNFEIEHLGFPIDREDSQSLRKIIMEYNRKIPEPLSSDGVDNILKVIFDKIKNKDDGLIEKCIPFDIQKILAKDGRLPEIEKLIKKLEKAKILSLEYLLDQSGGDVDRLKNFLAQGYGVSYQNDGKHHLHSVDYRDNQKALFFNLCIDKNNGETLEVSLVKGKDSFKAKEGTIVRRTALVLDSLFKHMFSNSYDFSKPVEILCGRNQCMESGVYKISRVSNSSSLSSLHGRVKNLNFSSLNFDSVPPFENWFYFDLKLKDSQEKEPYYLCLSSIDRRSPCCIFRGKNGSADPMYLGEILDDCRVVNSEVRKIDIADITFCPDLSGVVKDQDWRERLANAENALRLFLKQHSQYVSQILEQRPEDSITIVQDEELIRLVYGLDRIYRERGLSEEMSRLLYDFCFDDFCYKKFDQDLESIAAARLFERAYVAANSLSGKDLVLFLGQTGCGKSTALNFCLETPMRRPKPIDGRPYYELDTYAFSSFGEKPPQVGIGQIGIWPEGNEFGYMFRPTFMQGGSECSNDRAIEDGKLPTSPDLIALHDALSKQNPVDRGIEKRCFDSISSKNLTLRGMLLSESAQYPRVSASSLSETVCVAGYKYTKTETDVFLCDTPGTFDNRNDVYAAVSEFSFSTCFLMARSIKALVLVIDWSSVDYERKTVGGHHINTTFYSYRKFVPSLFEGSETAIKECWASVYICGTKAPSAEKFLQKFNQAVVIPPSKHIPDFLTELNVVSGLTGRVMGSLSDSDKLEDWLKRVTQSGSIGHKPDFCDYSHLSRVQKTVSYMFLAWTDILLEYTSIQLKKGSESVLQSRLMRLEAEKKDVEKGLEKSKLRLRELRELKQKIPKPSFVSKEVRIRRCGPCFVVVTKEEHAEIESKASRWEFEGPLKAAPGQPFWLLSSGEYMYRFYYDPGPRHGDVSGAVRLVENVPWMKVRGDEFRHYDSEVDRLSRCLTELNRIISDLQKSAVSGQYSDVKKADVDSSSMLRTLIKQKVNSIRFLDFLAVGLGQKLWNSRIENAAAYNQNENLKFVVERKEGYFAARKDFEEKCSDFYRELAKDEFGLTSISPESNSSGAHVHGGRSSANMTASTVPTNAFVAQAARAPGSGGAPKPNPSVSSSHVDVGCRADAGTVTTNLSSTQTAAGPAFAAAPHLYSVAEERRRGATSPGLTPQVGGGFAATAVSSAHMISVPAPRVNAQSQSKPTASPKAGPGVFAARGNSSSQAGCRTNPSTSGKMTRR